MNLNQSQRSCWKECLREFFVSISLFFISLDTLDMTDMSLGHLADTHLSLDTQRLHYSCKIYIYPFVVK